LRHICGDRSLSERLEYRIREVLSPLDLLLEFQSSQDQHAKSNGSLYCIEPNLKEGPGSLRDLHRARWIFKLLLGADNHTLDQAMRDRVGISDRQIAEAHAAADWHWRARTWMHLTAGKLSDVLIVNYQDRIARELNDCSAQTWLSRHVAHSETLARFRETAIHALLQGPFLINRFLLEDGSLHLSDNDSASVVSMLHIAQRYGIPVNLKDLRRLGEARESALEVTEPSGEEVWSFNQIIGEDRNVAKTVRALSDFGILDRLIPNFSEVMRFVPPDPAHRYTIGEHSIRMIEHLELLRAGRDGEGRRFAELLTQCSHFDMLCLAALLHDAGKLLLGNDHCKTGAELAESVAARLNLATEKRKILDIIIRQHLLLVRTARLQDLKSAHVIQSVAAQVPDMDALRHLYVFTYIDTYAVAEKNWTSMDERDLEDLYQRMQEFFSSGADENAGNEEKEDRGVLIRNKLAALQAKNETAVLKHCESMPAGYVLNTPLEEIAFHLQLIDRMETEGVVLDIYNRPGDDYSELTFCAHDDPQPGMLAKITGVLYGCNIDIHKAQAFTIEKEKPIILDTLWIRSNGMQISESKARRIQHSIKEVVTGAKSVEYFLEKAGKNPPHGIILDRIDLRNDLSEEHTVVHIVAHDLQGLLYVMTRSLSRCGLHIHSAKIATWEGRAENNFYVTATGGGQIPEFELPEWTKRLARVLRGDGV
jgi:[protein-PII] uridylyltransferase